MEFQGKSHFLGCQQKATGLLDGENALLTEDIAELCQIIMNHYGHHFADNVVHIFICPPVVFCRHSMCAEKSGDNVYTFVLVIIKATHHPELQELGFLVQTVAALSLYGSHSHSTHLLQKALRLAAQLDEIACTGSLHRTHDASSTFHDGHVTLSPQTPGELLGTLATKHKMCVRVHKAGQQALATGIVMPVALIIAVTLLATAGPDVGNDAVGHFHRGIVDDAKFLHLSAATGGKADGGDDTGVEYNKVFCHKASPLTPPP